ncbi:sigma factor-like helix-turn-helix DNA-binding protein [Oceanobacillus sp. FSL K6-0118]|uniref:sigma factor-like helix-turn-helix DNA-binding protein n=1 Tax=Oceanobacillus sp. FSL K6-0118 TaxID=2921418 RepID=UPI0030F63B99
MGNRHMKLEKKHYGGQLYSDILEYYKHQVYQICFYMIGKQNKAEEIAQTAFIEVYMKVRDYNFEKVSLKLFRITVALVLDWLRERTINGYSEIEMTESTKSIQKEILQLAVNDRLAIVLKHIVGFSVEEISDITQLPVSSVRRKIHCSREALCKRVN